MRGLFWNVRGLGSPRAVSALRSIVQLESPIFVFLSETKMKSWELDTIRRKVKMGNCFGMDCKGDGRRRSGGLALLWRNDISIRVSGSSLNYIDAMIDWDDGLSWRLTGLYGHPEEENKEKTKDLLLNLHKKYDGPWLCGGDFNLMLSHDEKRSKHLCNAYEIELFRDAVEGAG